MFNWDAENIKDWREWTPQATDEQQEFYEKLGDRRWDHIKKNERWALEKKVGFALFGEPTNLPTEYNPNGYNAENTEEIRKFCHLIYELSGWGEVFIAFLFVSGQIIEDRHKYGNKDRFCVSVLKVRTSSFAIVFLDKCGRVYQSWDDFMKTNTLPKSFLCYPLDGLYQADECGRVLLTFGTSPECHFNAWACSVLDKTATVVTVAATLVGVASIFVPVIAPIAIAAAMGGTGSGIYGTARGSYHLHDRRTHKQSISLSDSGARNCWLSVLGGALGVGSSLAVNGMVKLAASGQVLGKAGRIAVNVLNFGSLTVNGIGVINGLANLLEKTEKNQLTPLDVFQFASSVFFFTNATMNMKTASTIIKEVQTDLLSSYRAELDSNRRRNAFDKAMKNSHKDGTMEGNSQMIKGITKVGSKDEFFRVLIKAQKSSKTAKLNKDGDFEVKGARFVDTGTKIKTNVNNSETNFNNSETRSLISTLEAKVFKFNDLFSVKENTFLNLVRICSQLNKIYINIGEDKALNFTEELMRKFCDLLCRYFSPMESGSISSDIILNSINKSEKFSQDQGCETEEEFLEYSKFIMIFTKRQLESMEKRYQIDKAELKKEMEDDFNESDVDKKWGIQDSKDREGSFLKKINESNDELEETFENYRAEVTVLNQKDKLKFRTNNAALTQYYHNLVIDEIGLSPSEYFELIRGVANDVFRVNSASWSDENNKFTTYYKESIPLVVKVLENRGGILFVSVDFADLEL